jgi:hypothetical protein
MAISFSSGVPGENHRSWASNWQTLSLVAASRVTVLVIGLYELLGNPTTQLIEPPGSGPLLIISCRHTYMCAIVS